MSDNESRQPIECTSCRTVNAWMSEKCRSCGANLAEVGRPLDLSSKPPAPADAPAVSSIPLRPSETPGPARRLGIVWLALGAITYLAVVSLGAQMLQKTVLSADPQVAAVLEKSMAGGGEEALNAEEKAVLERHKPAIFAAVLPIMLGVPLLIGLVLGRLTGSLREAMWATGVGCVLANTVAVQSAALLALVLMSGAFTAGLGALGALAGRLLYRRAARRRSASGA